LLEDRLRSACVAVIPLGEGDPPLAASLCLHLPRIPADPSSLLFEWARWARLLDLMLPAGTSTESLPPWMEGEILHHISDLHLVTAGLASRVNERLSTVLPALERAIRLLDDEEPSLRFLRYVEEGLNRTSGLLSRLLTFASDAPLIAESVSMGDCTAEALRRLEPERSLAVRLTASIPTHLPLLIADRVQVIATLMEVIRNGLEAAPEGTGVAIEVEPEDDGISVSVTDEGVGMTDEVLRQAMLPFFSTKRRGEHPGLGLAMAEGCVRRHGGSITLSSLRGSGTKVRLWFPLQIQVP
ncbi:sensor histidine kinase, partial [Gemmatimonadota bacterium]